LVTIREVINNTCSPELVDELGITMFQCHNKMIEIFNALFGGYTFA